MTPPAAGAAAAAPSPHDDWDPLHSWSPDDQFWTPTNGGEAMPGVQTPLSITVWGRVATPGVDAAGRRLGAITDAYPMVAEAFLPFFGRAASGVNCIAAFGDRLPGTTGEQIVTSMLGHVPDGLEFAPTSRLYLTVLRKFPLSFVRVSGELARFVADHDAWWREAVVRVQALDASATRRFLVEAYARHQAATSMQCIGAFVAVQPVHDAVEQASEKLGGDTSTLTSPVGGAEMEVVGDIWRASRGECAIADLVMRHGFHGPLEGELSSTVWRDDDTPLRRMVEQYAQRPDEDAPSRLDAERARSRAVAEADLLRAASPLERPGVRLVLRLGRQRLHLRGAAKRSMLQGFDAVRAGSRRLGGLLAQDGALADAEDVFYLTASELLAPLPRDVAELVDKRRERRTLYEGYALPVLFGGVPTPIIVEHDGARDAARTRVDGIGVAAGVAEGLARVVTDPSFEDVEPDEILIAPTTDPSWSSIMFISAALVVDIGGALSHAAVVARELGIPCVVNTSDGTTAIRTGDRLRVDGGAGTVEILAPAAVAGA